MNITLIGFMGSGKTTIAQNLSNKLHVNSNDLDATFEKRSGYTIPEYFSKYGEEKFRQFEHQNLKLALHDDGIISTGGGTPMMVNNFQLIQDHPTTTIFLNAQDNTIKEHLIHDGVEKRPLFKKLGMSGILDLKHQRQSTYEKLADVVIQIDQKSPDVIVKEIMQKLAINQ